MTKEELILGRNSIFAKANFRKLYEYDSKGVKDFLDYHTHKVEYKSFGKKQDEVKNDIRRYTEKLMSKKVVKEYLDNFVYDNNTENYIFMYSLLNKKNPQDSVIVYCNESGEEFIYINPYRKGFEDIFEIEPEWRFSYYEGLIGFLDNEFEIIDIDIDNHYPIWIEVYERLQEPEDNKYKKGVENYLKYCKKHKITKEKIVGKSELENFKEDIMKFYKPKYKER